MDSGLALHKALMSAIRAALPESVGVYDAVPQNAAFPYVTIDTSITANEDALVERRDRHFVFLNVWSQTRGQAEVLSIMGQINTALHDNKMPLDTGRVVSVMVERKSTRRDADNVTFQGQMTLGIRTQY